MRKAERGGTEDRVLNSEFGMRNAERRQKTEVFEFGIGNSECGKGNWECGIRKERRRAEDRWEMTDDKENVNHG